MNGVFDLWFAQSWLLAFFAPDEYRRQQIEEGVPPADALTASDEYLARGERQIFSTWARQIPLTSFSEYRTLAPYYYEWLAHPNYDDYWATVDVEAQWEKIHVPALVNGAWGDLFAIGSVRSFMGMRAQAGSETARNDTMLVMTGGGGHGRAGTLNFGRVGNMNVQALQLRFYNHHLKDADNGIDREPRVQMFVQVPPDRGTEGSGFWVTGETFPLMGTETVKFNLRSGGHANTRWGGRCARRRRALGRSRRHLRLRSE